MNKPTQGIICGFVLDNVQPRKLVGVPVVVADRIGRNRNIYPAEELKKAVDFYKRLISLDPTHRYMLAKHPKDTDEEWMGLIAAVLDDLYFDEKQNALLADFTLLPTIWGHFVMWLLDNGYKIGLSIRGDAKPEPIYTELNGERVKAYVRKDIKLEGIDLVLYPSLITTHASNENFDRIVESYVKEASQCLNISSRILEATLRPKNIEDGRTAMQQMEFNRTVPPAAEDDKAAGVVHLKGVIERLTQEKEVILGEIQKLDEQLTNMQSKVEEESALYTSILNKRKTAENKLAEIEKKLEEKKKEYDELVKAIEEAREELTRVEEQAKRKVVVRFAGKTFDEENPPKIRVVPVDEKVDESPWGKVYKLGLRKLVWLTKDEKLAKQVFGIVRSMDDYRDLLYPVYKPYKSKEKGYDVDLVLNMQGLRTALAFFFGRPGMALSRDEKKQLLKFLLKKYKELDKAGIHPVPDTLVKAAKRLRVMEMFQAEDDFADAVLETAILKGLIEIEVDEDEITEQAVKLDAQVLLQELSAALFKVIQGSDIDLGDLTKIAEQAGDDFIKKLLVKEDGSQTTFAKNYGIGSVDEFKADFVNKLNTMVEEGDIRGVLEAVKAMIIAYGETSLAEDQAAALAQFMERVMGGIIEFFPAKAEEGGEEGAAEEPTAPETSPAGEEGSEPVAEKRKCKKKKKPMAGEDDQPQGDENTLSEEDAMVFEELKKLFEENFASVKIESPEQLIEAAKKLCEDYAELYAKVEAIELEQIREQKIKELVEAGVDESVAREELSDVTDPEEIEQIASTLMKLASKVTEQRKGAFVPAGKGVSVVNKPVQKGGTVDLDQLLETV